MKNLDINSANTNLSVDASQRVTIEFTGGNHSDKMQNGAMANTVTVPYSSLSKRLQAIHRFGGKITNISIHGLQLDLPRSNSEVVSAKEQEHVLEEIPAIAIEQAITAPLETHLELIVESTAQSVTPDISETVSEAAPEIKLERVSAPILENILIVIPEDAPESNSENISEAAVSVSTPQHEKVLSKTTAKPKKSKTSTKAGHGFSKKEISTQEQEPVAIAEIVATLEPVVEVISESVSNNQNPVVETTVKAKKSRTSTKTSNSVSKKEASLQGQEPIAIAEIVVTPEPVVEIVPEIIVAPTSEPVSAVEPEIESSEVTTPLSKLKKTKTSSKSGSGFNKPKSDPQTPRSQQKPKS